MSELALAEVEEAAALVHQVMPPTPHYCWPLLSARVGAEVWVKHENHTPIGAFKLRGGIVFLERLRRQRPELRGVITATRGNHGQSVAYSARRFGISCSIVVPHGNSSEKNAAMRALGADLIEHGHDFQAAAEHAAALSQDRDLYLLPSFHDWLVLGVASYALEFFRGADDLDTVYVPIGLGSGICATIAVRDALGLRTEIVGVVAAGAPAYALSFEAGRPVSTNSAETIADGVACRVPTAEAVERIGRGAARVLRVEDRQIEEAMRAYFTDTHNVAEGAGAAPLAALLQDPAKRRGHKVGLVLTGGNIDRAVYARILCG
jgi:threonine dehydratase